MVMVKTGLEPQTNQLSALKGKTITENFAAIASLAPRDTILADNSFSVAYFMQKTVTIQLVSVCFTQTSRILV